MHSHHATTSKRRIPLLAVGALALAGALGLSSATAAGAQTDPEPAFICHRTNSNANPYLKIDPANPGQNGGADHFGEHTGPVWNPDLKRQHIEWGDVIPPSDAHPDGSQAWQDLENDPNSAGGQSFIDHGCVEVGVQAPPPPVPTFDVTLDKVTTGGTAPSASTDFTFTVSCESGSVPSATVLIAAEDAPLVVATGVARDDNCTITETVANNATSTTFQVTGATPESTSTTANSVTFGVGAAAAVVATNVYPEPQAAVVPTPAQVLPLVVTPAPAEVEGEQLARTGSPAGYWYLLAGFAFVLGGVALYGSTARRLLHIHR